MALTAAHTAPLVALIAGILILIMPGLLNYIVAIYLIVLDRAQRHLPFHKMGLREVVWVI